MSGPALPAPVTVVGTATVDVPPGGTGGYIRTKGIASNGSGNADSVLVFALRPAGLQVLRDGFPTSAQANSTVSYRVLRTFGTQCGHQWFMPAVYSGWVVGTAYPVVTRNTQDTTRVDITMPSFVSDTPLLFGPVCVGQDKSVASDTLSIGTTYPVVSAIDSIIPRVVATDSTIDYRVFAHGCPFTSAFGYRGFPDAREGTLFLPAPWALNKIPVADVTFPRTTFESCNVVGFRWTWLGAKSGTPIFFYVGNPGQIPIELRVTVK